MPTNTGTDPRLLASMDAAPGADINFDNLFPIEDENMVRPQAPSGTPAASAPQAPSEYLKAGTSVYKTREEAEQGLAHKDALVNKYRSYLQTNGIDPNTFQPVPGSRPQAPTSQTPPAEIDSYMNNEDALFDRLSAAAVKGDKKGYVGLLRKYNEELLQSQFAPVAPLISEVARQRAARQVSSEIRDFSNFQTSDDYNRTLDSLPRLKQAIEYAENNFSAADSLGELYKIAYLVRQGTNRPAEVTPVVQAPVQSTMPSAPQRPTLTSSTMSVPAPSTPANIATSDGRKTLIRDAEARGIADMVF